MAIKITDECINCGACEPECPNNAIYDAGAAWRFSDGTGLKGVIDFGDGNTLNAEETQAALSDDIYYIVPDKCTECVGFMMSRSVLLYARLIAVLMTKISVKAKKNCLPKKTGCT
jgi:ferredoxin